jgi:putative thioredoxin
MANSPYVVDVTARSFSETVLEQSYQRPVLVDFWADWCAPCRMLTPVLTGLADSMGGKLLIAKVNTEEERELAAQFGIRSLPTVKLFRDGQVVDEFMGALPESDIRAFLERHVPRDSDRVLDQAEVLLTQGSVDAAAALVQQALASDPDNPRVALTRARLLAAQGDAAGAQHLLDALPLDAQETPEVKGLRAQLEFARTAAAAPPAEELRRRLEANPRDSEARYQLAARHVLAKDYETALELLLGLLRTDRHFGDDAARKGMVQVFELLGGSGDLVSRYRSKMTNALY